MMKKKLPVGIPVITCTPPTAGLMSVLAEKDSAKGWIYSNYIQLVAYYNPEYNMELSMLPWFDAALYCPWIIPSNISRDMISSMQIDFVQFIKLAINSGNYVYTILNQQYFKGSNAYKENVKFAHDTFICGYDDEEETVTIGDFYTGSYELTKIKYVNINLSYESIENKDDYLYFDKGGIVLWRYNEAGSYVFDSGLVKQTCSDFLLSNNTLLNKREIEPPNYHAKFGLGVYQFLINHLVHYEEFGISSMVKNLYVCRAHKTIMVERLKYMKSLELLNKSDYYIESYEKLEYDYKKINRLFVKFTMTENKDIVNKIVEMLVDLSLKEKNLIESLIDDIIIKEQTDRPHWYISENSSK